MTDKQEKSQLDKFKEAAREVRTDDSEERFDQVLKGGGKPKQVGDQRSQRRPTK